MIQNAAASESPTPIGLEALRPGQQLGYAGRATARCFMERSLFIWRCKDKGKSWTISSRVFLCCYLLVFS